jgi:hypothetical protein
MKMENGDADVQSFATIIDTVPIKTKASDDTS